MKSWLTKFRISAALDEGKPLPPSVSQALHRSEELRRFTERTRAVERELTETQPAITPPPALHRSIMRSIERAAEPTPDVPTLHFVRWLAAPAFAVVLALALWHAAKPSSSSTNPAPLASVGTTLEIGSTVPRTLAPALVAPLSDELTHLNQDLDHTAEFLLASLP